MRKFFLSILAGSVSLPIFAADQEIRIRFHATVGDVPFACGRSYSGVGTPATTITPRDFRLYIQDVELIGASGQRTPLQLHQDGKWQLDNVALLDFEDATGQCSNGTPETNTAIVGSVPAGKYTGLRFKLGVPFVLNHTDLTRQSSPLDLTALFWSWNGGHKFARLDVYNADAKRGFFVHLGSTGCAPAETRSTVPTQCAQPNRVEVELADFNIERDTVTADLAALLRDTNLAEKSDDDSMMGGGCMSSQRDSSCAGIFASFGLSFPGTPAQPQTFFRKSSQPVTVTAKH